MPLALSVPPEKIRKTLTFLIFSGDIERHQWNKMGKGKLWVKELQ